MSHTHYPSVKTRLQRSELAVPAVNPSMIDKAAESAADYIFLDLEDAIAPADKELARKNTIAALNDINWRGKTVSVRINGLDTHYMYRDVVDVMEQAGRHVDTLLVPKVGVASDLYMVEVLCSQIEQAKGLSRTVGLEALIETALGMANVETIAQSSRRLEALHFGCGRLCRQLSRPDGGYWRVKPRLSGRPMARRVVKNDRCLSRLWSSCD